MVDAGNVTADVADADAFDALALGASGHLEPIDYSVVDKTKTLDGYAWEFACLSFSTDMRSCMIPRLR